jgi:hypothetical protein
VSRLERPLGSLNALATSESGEFRDQYARVRGNDVAEAVGRKVLEGARKGNRGRMEGKVTRLEAVRTVIVEYEGDAPLTADAKGPGTTSILHKLPPMFFKQQPPTVRTIQRDIAAILAESPHLAVKFSGRGRPKTGA